MQREELAHVLRAASRIVPDADMLVIGSQAVHGGYDSSVLPSLTTLSREVDIAFWDDPDNARADRLDAAIGELSAFDETFGYYAQGVSVATAVLPAGWRERVIAFNDAAAEGARAWFLEPHDLALSKLAAQRSKDVHFVFELLDAALLETDVLLSRLATLPVPPVVRTNIGNLIKRHRAAHNGDN